MWAAILRHYDSHHRPRVEQERTWFAGSQSIAEAITRASLATNSRGKRFSHQRRIPRRALYEARERLLHCADALANAPDFDALLAVITSALEDIPRTGPLYRYDTALRISYYLGILPSRVYLHAGTRTGARALHLPFSNHYLDIAQLPAELRGRPAHEVEDILCIYKDHLPAPSSSAGRSPGLSNKPKSPLTLHPAVRQT